MRTLVILPALALLLSVAVWAQPADTDGDGLPNAIEKQLATDPNFAETLAQVATDKTQAEGDSVGKDNYAPGLDLVGVWAGNVAGDRYLWRVDFADTYVPDNSGIIIYLYGDDDPKTGRSDMGCEYMLVCIKGSPGLRAFTADGKESAQPMRAASFGKSLYLCADLTITQQEGQAVGAFHVLHETQEPHKMVDGIGKVSFSIAGESARQKIIGPGDLTVSRGMSVTWGFPLIESLKRDPKNIVIHPWECELQGYQLNIFTEYVNRHVIYAREDTRAHVITAQAPRAGRYHVGFITYQSSGRKNFLLSVGGKEAGIAVAGEQNNRESLFFTDKPFDLKAGTEIRLEAVAGTPLVEEIVLVPQPPPVVKLARKLTNLEARPALTLDGRLVGEVTFITTWPAVCKVTVASRSDAGTRDAGTRDAEPLANHRFWLNDVQAGQRYEVTVEATTPEGEAIRQQASFVAAIRPPAGKVREAALPLAMTNPYDFALPAWPVTQGLPFPQGALVSADQLKLLDAAGREVPLQATVLCYWPDYSIKWVLLDFQTDLAAKETARFRLEYGTSSARGDTRAHANALRIEEGEGAVTVNTGALQVELPRGKAAVLGRVWLDGNGDGQFGEAELISQGGQSLLAEGGKTGSSTEQPAKVTVMRRGPLHAVVRIDGSVAGATGSFGDQVELHFYAGKATVGVYHTFTNANGSKAFTNVNSLYVAQGLELGGNVKGQFGGQAGVPAPPAAPLRAGGATLWQGFDDSYRITGLGADSSGKRAANWGDVTGSKGGLTVAVRYLWQMYPKSLTLNSDGVSVGIMPQFAPGTYQISKEGELEDKLYYYLKDDVYRLKHGVSKRHEMLFAFHGPNAAPPANECAAFDEPPVLKADKNWYCDSKAFGDILPASPELGGIFLTYERNVEKAEAAYEQSRERGREYGMLNFGDWWGERGRNWGNIEYDTQYAFYLQFARSGDEQYLRLAEQAARHNRDVDMVWAGDPHVVGKVYAHCIGHTGRYYDHMVLDQGSPVGGFTVSHSWCEGYLADYFLSGDLRGLEAAALLTDVYDGYHLNNYDWGNCRTNGWHLILTMGMYRATSDPYYLNAARIIMARTREREDPKGGWVREMTPGHCLCLPRHRGEAAFMLGVLLSGLRDYNAVAREPDVDRMIGAAAHFMIRECWVPEKKTMRYTSCPVSSAGGGLSALETEGMMHGYMHAPDKVLGDVVKGGTVVAVRSVSGFGKSFTMQIRRTPAMLYQFAQADMDNYNFSPGQSVQILLRQSVDRGFMVTLRPRGEGQLGGTATLTRDGKTVAEVKLDRRPAVIMELPPGTGTGLYALKLEVAGEVPWDFDCDLDGQVVDVSAPTRLGPGIRIPAYMVFIPDTGKPTLARRGVGAGSYVAELRAPNGKSAKLSFGDKPTALVADPAAGIKGLCELHITKCPGAFEVQVQGTLPYITYWPSQMFALGEPLPAFNIGGNLGPGGSREVTFDATPTTDADNDVTKYAWDFGDGAKGEGKTVKHTYAKAGSFTVALTVSDKLGTSGSIKRPVSLPEDWVLALDPRQSLVIEAENFSGQGKGEVGTYDRIGNSGQMITKWEASAGHWLEWSFETAQAGEYNIVLRYCTGSDKARREITLDGQAVGAGIAEIVLPNTGGYCTGGDNWQYFRVPAKPGGTSTDEALRVRLGAGKHVLRLANAGGGLGLDQVMVLRAK
jgi:hypothetical protein